MTTRHITLAVVISLVLIASATAVIHADQPQASLSPDRILKGTTPTITITLDKSIPNQEQITGVRIGGQVVPVQKSGVEGKLFVQLPKLDFVGTAEVEIVGKDDKLVAVGQLKYVESSEQIKGLWLLLLYVFLIVLPPTVFNLYDIKKSYQERYKVLDNLQKPATVDEIKALLANMDQGPTGFTGLTRGIVAVTLILVLGIAVFHLVVFAPKVPPIAEQLLTLLAGTLTAITGFYFGSKAVAEATEATKSGNGKTGSTVVPTISSVDPTSGAADTKLRVLGEGFGTKQGKGTVKFSGKGIDKEGSVAEGAWNDTQIEVTVPSGMNGKVNIVVTNDNGISSQPFNFQITE